MSVTPGPTTASAKPARPAKPKPAAPEPAATQPPAAAPGPAAAESAEAATQPQPPTRLERIAQIDNRLEEIGDPWARLMMANEELIAFRERKRTQIAGLQEKEDELAEHVKRLQRDNAQQQDQIAALKQERDALAAQAQPVTP